MAGDGGDATAKMKETSTTTNQDKPGKPGAGDLMMEATNLLRSLRLPPSLNVMKISECGTGRQQVLLDSGATHALRPARSMEEWLAAEKVHVSLADGTTSSLRLKHGTRVLLSDPEKIQESTWIVPMGGHH